MRSIISENNSKNNEGIPKAKSKNKSDNNDIYSLEGSINEE
jgi:hypothetical protein